ncbi:HD domain-containing phosphohydrolase [Mesoaciditoga lauensis]|uniref:HD domain-containing phosphohydrolase n=1 Tax=Mesoaciditoga lauensis TaxID=1495039 RepID=UPI00068E90B2|nr:HD domain-containing phosphohydrolase [Mesoaciditoga lauensis]
MRKTLLFFVLLVSFFAFSFSLTVKVGIYDNPPLSFYKNGSAQGILVNVMNFIAQKENWKVEYVYESFSKLLPDLKSGKIDMLLGIAETKERKSFCYFTNEFFLSNWAQVYKHKGSSIDSFFDLNGKRVGVLKSDIFYGGPLGIKYFLEHLNVKTKFVEFNSYPDIFKAVKDKTIDAGVVNRFFGVENASKYRLQSTSMIFYLIEEKAAFSKQSHVAKIIAPVVDRYIKQMKENDNSVLNESISKYLNVPSARPFIPKWVFYVFGVGILVFVVLAANVIILRKLVKKEASELERKNEELSETIEELTASNEEIRAINEELENAYSDLEKLSKRFRAMVVSLSQLDMIKIKGEEFLEQMLNRALEMIPVAKYGSIWIFDEKKWKIVACRGHDEKILKDPKVDFELARFDKVQIVKDILKEDEEQAPSKALEVVKKATKPIKESLVAPLKFLNETLGYMSLDIPKGSEYAFSQDDVEILSSFSKIATAFYVSRKYMRFQRDLQERLTLVLVKALEKYNVYTKGHSERVAECSRNIAKMMGMDEEAQRKIHQAGLLHDVGKIFVPLEILNKNGKLTSEEYNEIKKHPIIGAELIEEGAQLKNISKIVRHHHERWDGKGYPDGLKGEEIPLESRIMAVCDTFDAMTSDRPYRKALSEEMALEEIEKNAGKQFDPAVVEVFLKMQKESKMA